MYPKKKPPEADWGLSESAGLYVNLHFCPKCACHYSSGPCPTHPVSEKAHRVPSTNKSAK